jgi:hypothetical protein
MSTTSLDRTGNPKLGPTTQVRDMDKGYEMETMDKVVVKEKYRGTSNDRHDMQVLGRIQELRVRKDTQTNQTTRLGNMLTPIAL